MGSSKKVTIGYRYYMGVHVGIGRGPVNEIVEWRAGDKEAFKGSIASNGRVYINKPGLFGGEKKEGGIQGWLDVLMGGSTQTAPGALASMLGGDVPGFRGMVTLFYDGMVSAMTPYIKPWQFRVRRSTAGWDGEPWYPARARILMADGAVHAMNPAHIIYECMTNRDWGGGHDRSRLDDASFRAAADRLHDEGFGLCLRWNRACSVEEFTQIVLDHIGGNLYLSRFDGAWHLTLNRDDYNAADLPLFDEDSGLLAIDDDESSAIAGAVNEVILRWHDPVTNTPRQWRERNLAAVRAAGQVNSERLDFPGIPTEGLAGRLAMRELRIRAGGIKRFKVRLDRRGYRIEPGQPFRIRSLRRGIVEMVVRAGRIEDGTLDSAAITISVVQDVFGLPATSLAQVQPPSWAPPDRAPRVTAVRRLVERTWAELAAETDPANLALIEPTASYLSALAVRPTSLSHGFALQTRVGGGAWQDAGDGDFCPSGLLVSDMGPAETAFQLTVGSDIEFVAPGGVALLGDEIVRVVSFDPEAAVGTLARGCVDTVPAAHAAGTRIWFYQDSTGEDPTIYTSGVSVQARLLTQTSEGQLDPALAPIDSLAMSRRQSRPYPPGNLMINGRSWPTGAIGEITLSWAHRDRLLQADQVIDHLQGSIGPEPGTTYTARLLQASNNNVLASETGIIGTAVALETTYEGEIIVELWAVRDGLDSWQKYQHRLLRTNPITEP